MFSFLFLLSLLLPCAVVAQASKKRAPQAREALPKGPRRKVVLGPQRIARNRVHYCEAINYRETCEPHAPTGKNGRKSVRTIFADRMADKVTIWVDSYPALGALVENIMAIAPKREKDALKTELRGQDVIGIQGHRRWLDLEAIGAPVDCDMPIVVKHYDSWQEVLTDLGADNEGDKDTQSTTSKLARWNLVSRAMASGMTFCGEADFLHKLGFARGPQQESAALLVLAEAIGVENFTERANITPDRETGRKVYQPDGFIPVSSVRSYDVTGAGNEEKGLKPGCLREYYVAMKNGDTETVEALQESAAITAEQYIASLFGTQKRAVKGAGPNDWNSYMKLPKGTLGRELAIAVRSGPAKLAAFMTLHDSLMRQVLAAPTDKETAKHTAKHSASGKVPAKPRRAKRAAK